MLMRLINGLVSRKNRWGRHFLMKKKGPEGPRNILGQLESSICVKTEDEASKCQKNEMVQARTSNGPVMMPPA